MDLNSENIFSYLVENGYDFFTGVPDSGLKDFQNNIIDLLLGEFNASILLNCF